MYNIKNGISSKLRAHSISLQRDDNIFSNLKTNLKLLNLIFVSPCVISIDGKEESQLDATITIY